MPSAFAPPPAHSLSPRPAWSRLVLVAGLLASAAGCGGDDGPTPLAVASSAIVNGQIDNGHPGVVALAIQGNVFCTGTLITPNVVLTAAHCLPPNVPVSYTDIDIFFGTSNGNGQYIGVSEGWTNPNWNDEEIYYDIGLVRLQGTAPAAPIPMNSAELSIGQATTLVGFGVTSGGAGNSGVKRVGTAQVTKLDPWVLVMGANPSGTCSGDSGGTTLVTVSGVEYVAGVHSRADCMGQSIDMRVDGYSDDIQAFLGVSPECGSDGLCAENCAAPDPDCPCADDGHCTAACADSNADPDCDPNCIPNGVCAQSCAQLDSDCDCSGNGVCNPLCVEPEADPDCIPPECAEDGQCNPNCELDADCWSSGDVEDVGYRGVALGSCQAGVPGGGPMPPAAIALLAALGLLLRRRQDHVA